MSDKLKIVLGLPLCVIGSILILRFFPLAKSLIIIPIILFFLSMFIPNRLFSLTLNALTILPFLIFFIGLIPVSGEIRVESRIRYQIIDFGQGDFFRNGYENESLTRRVFLADTPSDIQWLYVDNSDFKRLWPESPQKMAEKNYTIKAKFETRKLLFGDYSTASVVGIDTLNEPPIITK